MSETAPFIKSIQINKVRHLQNIKIEIDNDKPRHLILTGPNGCGKTSLLRVLKEYLEGVPGRQLLQITTWSQDISNFEQAIQQLLDKLPTENTEEGKATIHGRIASNKQGISHYREQISKFNATVPSITDLPQLVESYHQGKFIISFFEAKRSSTIQAVSGAQKLDLPTTSPITVAKDSGSVGTKFLQFLVNQENRAALLLRKSDFAGVTTVQRWMETITQKLRDLFQNPELKLEYDIDNFDFTINIPGREPFRLVEGQLSDGFSAALQIVSELLMRMEAMAPGVPGYEIPGIVLIDEIETHLHIKLQKSILPFLTGFFPKIQFIVTTHSPFVLTSLADAVIFDLESQERWENMTPLAASTVIEEYFDLDLYSEAIKNKIEELDKLVRLSDRTPDEEEELKRICRQLDDINYDDAPELVAQYRALLAKDSTR